MSSLINNEIYLNDLKDYSKYSLDWNKLKNKSIMISGSTGLVGRYFIDLLMYKNNNDDLNCKLIALGRDKNKALDIFDKYINNSLFEFIECDVNLPIEYSGKVDFVIHAASNTHPVQYSTDPAGTIKTNVFGTYNLLELAKQNKSEKFILISSFEVYGTVTGKEKISENDFGVVDCTILRSCYPESKRLSENLTIAYANQYEMNTNIVRLSRVFGPTMNYNSSLATAQFIKSGINKEDIILKSDGLQKYSYNYVGDAVISILLVLLNGENKEAYNVSDEKFDCSLKDFATTVANYAGKSVKYDIPNESEKKGFSNLTMTILDNTKIKSIGFHVNNSLEESIIKTIDILEEEK